MSSQKTSYNLSISFVDIQRYNDTEDILSRDDISSPDNAICTTAMCPDIVDLLEEYKTRITEIPRIYSIIYKGEPFNAIVHWKRGSVVSHYNNIMGDLVAQSLYDDHDIIYSHTKQMLYEIDNEMKEKYPYTKRCLIFNLYQ